MQQDLIKLPQGFDDAGRQVVELLFDRGGIDFKIKVFRGESHQHDHVFFVPKSQAPRAAKLLFHFWEFEEGSATPLVGFSGSCEACGADVVDVYDCPDCGISLAIPYHRPDWLWGTWFRSWGLDVDFAPKEEDPPMAPTPLPPTSRASKK